MAWQMGHERALEWQRTHSSLPEGAGANEIADLVSGADAAEHLGAPGPRLRAQLTAAAPRFSAMDYLLWDPSREPPPGDLPEPCPKCGEQNARGATKCARCGAKLNPRGKYDLYTDTLIAAYSGDTAGIPLGSSFRDVWRWLPGMHPYPVLSEANWSEFWRSIYTATHVIYTYNFYSRYRVSRDCLPEEFAHLHANLEQAVKYRDPEVMGEFLDTLRAFGLDFSDESIRAGFDFLLSTQNPDGSWGDPNNQDLYSRYHTTWTVIDGLRDYRWTEVLPCPK
jgi:hypothetical protein